MTSPPKACADDPGFFALVHGAAAPRPSPYVIPAKAGIHDGRGRLVGDGRPRYAVGIHSDSVVPWEAALRQCRFSDGVRYES
jgi:hypothetical protein